MVTCSPLIKVNTDPAVGCNPFKKSRKRFLILRHQVRLSESRARAGVAAGVQSCDDGVEIVVHSSGVGWVNGG